MSKTITDEKIKLSIIIDGNNAQKELFDLEKSTRKLTEETKGLTLQKKLLEKQGKQGTEQYKLLTATIKSNNAEVAENKLKMQALQKEIGLTGLTMNQLTQKATVLRMTLKNLVPGSADYQRYKDELTQVTNRIGELSGKAQQSKFSLSSMADGFNKYQGLFLSAAATLTGIVFSVQKIIDINGKLSDSQADVMKTTGMNKKEVDELTKSFGALETRTSRIDLLKIAEQGGRIGIAKAEIGDFVNVMNKAAVALGDSFTGGAEEVSNKLGKIKFLFQETKDLNVDQAYNAIGSAINDLGANGVASEANIAEFTTRIGSLTDVLKPTIQETLALGTAFEESGLEAEVSSRAYGIFMKQASTESAKFAQVMGVSQKSVEDMINTNPLEFMLNFAEGMKGMDATETAKTLDFLGISADGANKVIGAMGNNTARFRELIDLSNDSFASGTSLINEYTIKNETLGATLEKIGKKVSGWFSSETFIQYLGGAVTWFAKFIGATEDADGSVTAWKNTLAFTAKIIAIVTAALLTNVAWQKLVVMWTTRNTEATILYNIAAKARAFADGVGMIASQAFAGVMMLLRGNVLGAAQAFRVMTAAMMTTPWGFILGAIASIGTAYVMFSDNAKEAVTAQSLLNENLQEANAIVATQKIGMESLLKVANDEAASKETRLAAIKKLNEISPEYLGNLTLENLKTAEGKKLIDDYVKSLEKKAMLEVLTNKQKAIVEDMNKQKSMSLKDEIKWYDEAWANIKNLGNAGLADADLMMTASKRRQQAIDELQKKLNLTNAEMAEFLKKNPNAIADVGGDVIPKSTFKVPGETSGASGSDAKDPNSTQEEINRLRLENNAKYNDLILKQQRQLEDDRIAAMEEGYAKELAIENQRYQREIDDLNKQKVHTDEMAKMDEDIAKAKQDKDIKKYNALLEIKAGWAKKNETIDAQINEIIEGKLAIHNLKVATIEEKAAAKSITDLQEKYKQEKVLRETAFLSEINQITTLEQAKEKLKQLGFTGSLRDIKTLGEAKEALQKQFNENELSNEEKHLREVLAKFDEIVKKNGGGLIDLSLLTPDQVAKFKKEAEELGLTLQQLIDKKNSLTGQPNAGDKQATDSLKSMAGNVDVFGFSPEQWQQTFDSLDTTNEKIAAAVAVVGALVNAWGMYNEFLATNEKNQLTRFERNTETKKRRLKQQLDSGVITQAQYNKGVEKIDSELDKKKAEIEYKQAKRQKQMAIANVMMNTAQAIIGIWAQFPKFDFGATAGIMSGVVGGLGLLQLAKIASTPLPAKGYEKGLYGDYIKREQDGKVFQAQYGGTTKSGVVTRPTYFLTGENGPEMIIDNRAFRRLSPEIKDSLLRELRGIKGYEQGLYNQQTKRYEFPVSAQEQSQANTSLNNNDQMMAMMMSLVSENIAVLKDLKESGVIAYVSNRDFNSMKNLKEGLKRYDQLRNSNKIS
jgi:tubulin-specific chaperone A